jgi:hypothetical protein
MRSFSPLPNSAESCILIEIKGISPKQRIGMRSFKKIARGSRN